MCVWETEPRTLQEQPVLLSSEPPLQSPPPPEGLLKSSSHHRQQRSTLDSGIGHFLPQLSGTFTKAQPEQGSQHCGTSSLSLTSQQRSIGPSANWHSNTTAHHSSTYLTQGRGNREDFPRSTQRAFSLIFDAEGFLQANTNANRRQKSEKERRERRKPRTFIFLGI